jgi:hypothetical protein
MPRNPTDQLLGIQIKSDTFQPDLNACTWKLLTVVEGLHLVVIMPSSMMGHSDCMSAIICLNDAMLAFQDTQSSVKTGVLNSGGYKLRVTEEDTRDRRRVLILTTLSSSHKFAHFPRKTTVERTKHNE